MKNESANTRRDFIKASALLVGAGMIAPWQKAFAKDKKKVIVSGHLWVYASAYPPKWDSTPILEKVFTDFKYAGIEGVELMDINLRHNDAVKRIGKLIKKHKVPVTGTSYSAAMWNKEKQNEILKDAELIIERLGKLGGKNFGISVGNAEHIKTAAELDAQAELLLKIRHICKMNGVLPNIHNHTYEVENDLHDLKGILERIPDMELGPDLNWLMKAGVDPIWFINTYGKNMVYMHLRDQNANAVWTEALGEGITDFKGIAEALKKINYSGDAAIELAFPNDFKPTRELKETWKISRDLVTKVFHW